MPEQPGGDPLPMVDERVSQQQPQPRRWRVLLALVLVVALVVWWLTGRDDDRLAQFKEYKDLLDKQRAELLKFPDWNTTLIPPIWANRSEACRTQVQAWQVKYGKLSARAAHATNLTGYFDGLVSAWGPANDSTLIDVNYTSPARVYFDTENNRAPNVTAATAATAASLISTRIFLREETAYLQDGLALIATMVAFGGGSIYGMARANTSVWPFELLGALPDDELRKQAYPAILDKVEVTRDRVQRILDGTASIPSSATSSSTTNCTFFIYGQILPFQNISTSDLQRIYDGMCCAILKYNTPTGQFVQSLPPLHMHLLLDGVNCNYTLSTAVPLDGYDSRVLRTRSRTLGVCFWVASALKLVLTVWTLDRASSPASLQRLSWATQAGKFTLDCLLCVVMLSAGLGSESNSRVYLAAAFTEIVGAMFFGNRLLLKLLMTHQVSWAVSGQRVQPSILLRFYILFFALGFGLLGGYTAVPMLLAVELFLLYAYEIPQILHSARQGTVSPLSIADRALGLSLRAFLAAYLLVCPVNMISMGDVGAFAPWAPWLGVWAAVQVMFALSQRVQRFGPAWFLPRRLRAQRYAYERPLTDAETDALLADEQAAQCSICMCALVAGHVEDATGAQQVLLGEAAHGTLHIDVERDRLMVTPCHHVFHADCLSTWLERRLQCPSCRLDLPPP